MAIVLRCNVFQITAPEPGLFLMELADIRTRFEECAKLLT